MRTKLAFVAALLLLCFSGSAFAQYNAAAGKNKPKVMVEKRVRAIDGTVRVEAMEVDAPADRWGNAQGNANDLAIDGAFEGQTVAVIQLYDFPFELVRTALKEKGFSVYRWSRRAPSPAELEAALAKSSQLWIIADQAQQLNADHLRVIKKFFDDGHGVYIWGDNQPYYADANYVAQALFGAQMLGDVRGDHTVGLMKRDAQPGIKPNHLLTTGLEHLYEGITIATIQPNDKLEPLLYGSAGNLVASYYDKAGRRAILDGGFTRLYNKWDTAGTARYVKNAASWLVNAERFGDAVINPAMKKPPVTPPVVEGVPDAVMPRVVMTVAPQAKPSSADGRIALVLCAIILALLVAMNVPAVGRKDH